MSSKYIRSGRELCWTFVQCPFAICACLRSRTEVVPRNYAVFLLTMFNGCGRSLDVVVLAATKNREYGTITANERGQKI